MRAEPASTLQDVLLPRTMVAMGPDAGLGPDRAAADLAVRFGGWDEEQADAHPRNAEALAIS